MNNGIIVVAIVLVAALIFAIYVSWESIQGYFASFILAVILMIGFAVIYIYSIRS